MGKERPDSQQSPIVAHGAASKTRNNSHKLRFIPISKSSENYSHKRGDLLGEMRPVWIKAKESECRVNWLRTMVRLELVVRDIEAYARSVCEKLRSDELKFKEEERKVLLGIMKLKLKDENINLRGLKKK